jgi:hypothetical protein
VATLLFSPHFCRSARGERRSAYCTLVQHPRVEIEMARTIGFLRNGHGGNSRAYDWHKTPTEQRLPGAVCSLKPYELKIRIQLRPIPPRERHPPIPEVDKCRKKITVFVRDSILTAGVTPYYRLLNSLRCSHGASLIVQALEGQWNNGKSGKTPTYRNRSTNLTPTFVD